MQDAVAGVPHIFVVAAVFLKLLRSVMLLYAHLPPRCTAVHARHMQGGRVTFILCMLYALLSYYSRTVVLIGELWL
jgi:hypothetical protein